MDQKIPDNGLIIGIVLGFAVFLFGAANWHCHMEPQVPTTRQLEDLGQADKDRLWEEHRRQVETRPAQAVLLFPVALAVTGFGGAVFVSCFVMLVNRHN